MKWSCSQSKVIIKGCCVPSDWTPDSRPSRRPSPEMPEPSDKYPPRCPEPELFSSMDSRNQSATMTFRRPNLEISNRGVLVLDSHGRYKSSHVPAISDTSKTTTFSSRSPFISSVNFQNVASTTRKVASHVPQSILDRVKCKRAGSPQ